MPANLPPEARAKWMRVARARTKEEKLQALIEFLSAVPKHKGTEKLVKQVRRQIARLKREIELEKVKKRGSRPSLFVEKEGAFQVVLLGLPNTGKSTIFRRLTGVEVRCGEAFFETKRPIPGMAVWEGLDVQLVDTPSLVEALESERNSLITALAYNADALLLVVDGSREPLRQLRFMEELLSRRGITIRMTGPRVRIERRRSGGIVVVGPRELREEAAKLLRSYGIHHALVWIEGHAKLEDVESALLRSTAYKPAAVLVTKVDLNPRALEKVREAVGHDILALGATLNTCRDRLMGPLFKYMLNKLGLIRVYTRNPKTGEVGAKPLVVKSGTRVIDVARIIHSRLSKGFRYALVWNDERLKFSPMRVGRDFELHDGDIVEIVA